MRQKLLLAFGSIGLLTGAVGFIAMTIDWRIKENLAQVSHGAIEKPRAAAQMSEALLILRLRMDEFLADRQAAGATSSQPVESAQKSAEVLRQASDQFEASLIASRKATLNFLQLVAAEGNPYDIKTAHEETALLEDVEARFTHLKGRLATAQSGTTGNQEEISSAQTPVPEAGEQIARLVQDYRDGTERQLLFEIDEIITSLGEASSAILWSTVAILAVGVALAWLFARGLSRPLSLLTSAAQRIGQGRLDTTVDIRGRHEFGLLAQTFNRMTGDLRSTTVSRDYVDSIIKSMPNSLVVLEPDRNIKSVNETTSKLLGYTEDELIGQPVDCILDTRTNGSAALLDEVAKTGFLRGASVTYQTKSGAAVPMTFSASVVRDADNATTGLVCVAEDISERKKAERELENVQKELMLASRQAGMAEVATNVLHNVGNVLNSINVASTLVNDSLRKSKAGNLGKAVALLDEHATDLGHYLTNDPKGKQLPSYLRQLNEHLGHEREAIAKEMESLRKNVDHIKDIVAMQQNYAKIFGVAETVNVVDLVEDALRMNAGALVRHDVNLVRDFQEVPPLTLERHKVLQVLVNVIRNAKYACDESGRADKLITVRVGKDEDHVKISIIDNGIGIPTENLTRIFNHGFTTRKEGHGFGLHSGALAAQELGGSLLVQSDGPGHGATFTLQLPRQAGDNSHE